MEIVYRPYDMAQANLLVAVLKENNISSFIGGQDLLGGIGGLPVDNLLTLSTDSSVSEKAKTIIKDYLNAKLV